MKGPFPDSVRGEGGIMSDQDTSEIRFRERGIRVFVSSTFRDMKAERDELVNIPYL